MEIIQFVNSTLSNKLIRSKKYPVILVDTILDIKKENRQTIDTWNKTLTIGVLVCCLVWSECEVTLSSYKSVRAINKLSALAKTSDVTERLIVSPSWPLIGQMSPDLASDWSRQTPGTHHPGWDEIYGVFFLLSTLQLADRCPGFSLATCRPFSSLIGWFLPPWQHCPSGHSVRSKVE